MELQTFIGMVVYFQSFMPYFADHMTPLFNLLKKGMQWTWDQTHKYTWMTAKQALQKVPVLSHPIEGLSYRLYTDASDDACECT